MAWHNLFHLSTVFFYAFFMICIAPIHLAINRNHVLLFVTIKLKLSSISKLIPRHNAVSGIWQIFGFSLLIIKSKTTPICRHCHLKTHVQPLHLILTNFCHST